MSKTMWGMHQDLTRVVIEYAAVDVVTLTKQHIADELVAKAGEENRDAIKFNRFWGVNNPMYDPDVESSSPILWSEEQTPDWEYVRYEGRVTTDD